MQAKPAGQVAHDRGSRAGKKGGPAAFREGERETRRASMQANGAPQIRPLFSEGPKQASSVIHLLREVGSQKCAQWGENVAGKVKDRIALNGIVNGKTFGGVFVEKPSIKAHTNFFGKWIGHALAFKA